MSSTSKLSRAFTLVEMLFIIIVFGTGVLAVLYGISQALKIQDKAEVSINSSFFATEGIELMFALRDANYTKSLPRNCIFKDFTAGGGYTLNEEKEQNIYCQGYFTSGTLLKLSLPPISSSGYIFAESGVLDTDFDKNFETFQLFYLTGETTQNGKKNQTYSYVHSGNGGQPLRYARYILLKPIYDGPNSSQILNIGQILKIESHVLYRKGALTGETIMESFIGNYY